MDMLETGAFLALCASCRFPARPRLAVCHTAPRPRCPPTARAPLQAATSSAPWPTAGSRT
jgi:hypothetical protein